MLNFLLLFFLLEMLTEQTNPSSLGCLRMVFVLRSVLRGLTWFRTNIVNVQFSLCENPPTHTHTQKIISTDWPAVM